MSRYRNLVFLMAVMCMLVSGCGKELEEKDVRLYYQSQGGTALVTEGHNWESNTAREQAEEALEKLRKPEDTVACVSVIPADVLVTGIDLEGDCVDVNFSQEYERMDVSEEILLRAAVVYSLTQIDGVRSVRFRVSGSPLLDREGAEIGAMKAEDFVLDI